MNTSRRKFFGLFGLGAVTLPAVVVKASEQKRVIPRYQRGGGGVDIMPGPGTDGVVRVLAKDGKSALLLTPDGIESVLLEGEEKTEPVPGLLRIG